MYKKPQVNYNRNQDTILRGSKIMQRLSNKQKLGLILVIALIALVLQFGFHYPLLAQIIVTIAGALVALTMFIGMIKTLRSGKYGVDLLAILAVVATLSVSEYWPPW